MRYLEGRRPGFIHLLVPVVVIVLYTGTVYGKVKGLCSNCHTMHYSQGGGVLSMWGSSGPYKMLLVNDCVGCHSNTESSSTVMNGTPIVFNTSYSPTYPPSGSSGTNCLAGGNFYWVKNQGNSKGHNVLGIVGPDTRFSNVPGSNVPYFQLTCAGSSGCHGNKDISDQFQAIKGAHHEDDTVIDGSTVGKSYRFLYGILGKEDGDWEQSVSNSDHNQYKGCDRSSESSDNTTTISHLCGECHGDFHSGDISSGTWGSPWLRHPTDYDMGNTPSDSEFRDYYYQTKGDNLYNPLVPLASESVSQVISHVNFDGDTVIMCLSCHRVHGSPYDSIMRWNYKGWPGSGTNGCVICHTSKD